MKSTNLLKLLLISLLPSLILTTGCNTLTNSLLEPKGYKLNNSVPFNVGDTIKSESKMSTTSCKVTTSQADTEVSGDCKFSTNNATDTEVLELNAKEVSKLKRFYSNDISSFSFTFNGKTEENTEPGSFHQKSILLEKTNGVWNSTLIDGKPTAEQSKLLKEEKPELEDYYPSKSLKIGESWDMGNEIRKYLGSDFLISSSSVNATLKEIVEHQGEKCALIEVVGDIKGTQLDSNNNEIQIQMSLNGNIYRSLSSFVDIDSKFQGVLKYEGSQTEKDQKLKITITGNYELTGSDSILRKI
jgi:hypothetical protein